MAKLKEKVTPVKKATKEELERKKRLAYTLYVENNFEQKVISDITGIGERSISKWKTDNNWEDAKEEARMGIGQRRKRILKHFDTLLTAIESRETPNNVPTPSEGDTLNKLADAIKKLQTEVSYSHRVQVGKEFIAHIQEVYSKDKAVDILQLWHDYLMSTK